MSLPFKTKIYGLKDKSPPSVYLSVLDEGVTFRS